MLLCGGYGRDGPDRTNNSTLTGTNMKETQISHDGFARESTLRVKGHSVDGCAWCGTTGVRLWRYGTERDGLGSRKAWDTKQFCSKSCRDTYYS